jgi:nitroimidazol reductase NimA-like FMN-containing flavoprotein (pyridoxamine 5'-phosphate oxidase superfamily)
MTDTLRSKRTEVHRLPNRGAYDSDTIHAILDEALICHVGFVFEDSPFVIPTGYGRVGNQLLIHGSSASRMLRALSTGAEACITVTLVDGLVLARSAFHTASGNAPASAAF